ncbi:MAG: hypothetical protein IT193_03140, partial [Propionibacteriaceae bacterium]|nr:hypothetical protein [Propionibacteriaceae bacterium]
MPRLRWRNRLSALLRAAAERLDPAPPAAAPEAPDFWLELARSGRPVGTGAPPAARARPAPGHRRPFRLHRPAGAAPPTSVNLAAPEPGAVPRPPASTAGEPPTDPGPQRRHLVTARRQGPVPGPPPGAPAGGPGSRRSAQPDRGQTPSRSAAAVPTTSSGTGPAPDAPPSGGTRRTGPAATAGHPATTGSARVDATRRRDRQPDDVATGRRLPLRQPAPTGPRLGPAPQAAAASGSPGEPERPAGAPVHAAPPGRAASDVPWEPDQPGLGGHGFGARPAPTTPAGGSRLLLRPWPGDPLPGRPAARIPDLTDPPTPA